MTTIVDIEFSHLTPNGARYKVWRGEELFVKSSKAPIFDAARALVDKGVTGRVQQRRKGRSQIDMEGLIAVLATKTISETENNGPRIIKYQPYNSGD